MDKFQASNWGQENSNLENEKEIVIRVTGNGFLYNMVRIIAGTLIRVGRGFYEPEKIRDILRRRNILPRE